MANTRLWARIACEKISGIMGIIPIILYYSAVVIKTQNVDKVGQEIEYEVAINSLENKRGS